MKNINFIFIRSKVGENDRFKDEEKERYLKEINVNNDFIFSKSGQDVFFIETGGTEEIFKSIYLNYKEPYFILATDANNSLPASLEIATFLRKNNKKFKLIHGNSKEIREQLKSDEILKICGNSRVFSKNNALFGMKFGVIGKPSDWLIASDVNYNDTKQKLGASLVDISSEEFLNVISNQSLENVDEKFLKLINEKVSKETLNGAFKIYMAIKQIISKYNLDGITVRCFDLLSSVKNTSCLALAMLNAEGYIATCEGDIPAMLTMALVRKLFNISSFQVNPSYLNLKERYGYFAHCTLPLDMCDRYYFDTHFESGIGLGVKGILSLKDVTIFKVNGDLSHYEIFEGKIDENLNKQNLCRTQVKVSFRENIDDMFTLPNGNHLIIFYGHHKEELVKILSY